MRALIAQDAVKSTGFQAMDISIFWQVALQKADLFLSKVQHALLSVGTEGINWKKTKINCQLITFSLFEIVQKCETSWIIFTKTNFYETIKIWTIN